MAEQRRDTGPCVVSSVLTRAELPDEVGYETGIDLEALIEFGKELPGRPTRPAASGRWQVAFSRQHPAPS